MALMGVDAGITGVKAVAFSTAGDILSQSYREYALHQPQRGWSELDPHELWAAAAEVIAEAASGAGETVTALAVSSMGEAAVPLDGKGEPLARIISPMDRRATPVTESLVERFGREKLFRITGLPPHPCYTVNHVLWLRENDREVFAKAEKFLCVQDYIGFRLTGEAVMDLSMAERTALFDVTQARWSDELFGALDLSPEIFSRPVEGGTPVGRVRAETAGELGLSPETIVVAGGHDQPACAVGAGAIAEGIADLSLGTVECLTNTHAELRLTDEALSSNIPVYRHALPGHFCSLAYNFTSGALLKWFRDNFAAAEAAAAEKRGKNIYTLLFEKMPDEVTPVLVVPHFVGTGTPHLDPLAKGAVVNLDLSTTKADVFHACAQGAVLEMMLNFEVLKACRLAPHTINAIGGGARSAKWLQMRADALAVPVNRMDVEEAGCAGVAVLAGCAAGVFADVAEGARRFARVAETIAPRPERAGDWQRLLEKYRGLYEALEPFRL